MTQQPMRTVGMISWQDLTVANAKEICDFYQAVVGWSARAEDMGEYQDYSMRLPGSNQTIAGICHARGENADLPPQWLIYITVADIHESAAKVVELGGAVLSLPRRLGGGEFCVIRDPAGAVCALFQPIGLI